MKLLEINDNQIQILLNILRDVSCSAMCESECSKCEIFNLVTSLEQQLTEREYDLGDLVKYQGWTAEIMGYNDTDYLIKLDVLYLRSFDFYKFKQMYDNQSLIDKFNQRQSSAASISSLKLLKDNEILWWANRKEVKKII